MAEQVTAEQLADLVRQYLETEAKLNAEIALTGETRKRAPKRPTRVPNLEEAQRYAESVAANKAAMNRLDNIHRALLAQLDSLKSRLINTIGVSNVWIKVGDKAVGLYGDTWGGWHTVIAIKDWREDLEPLEDHTYYP